LSKKEDKLTREDVEKIVKEANKKVFNEVKENIKFLIECAKTTDTAIQDLNCSNNDLKQSIEAQTNVMRDTINKLIEGISKLGDVANTLASRGGGGRRFQPTFKPTDLTKDKLPEYSRDKIKITKENGKVVVRTTGYLGGNKEDSKKKWQEVNKILRDHGIKWVRNTTDYRWEE
jgi:hypothetical protein